MQTTSEYRPTGINRMTVGIAIAGSALFVMCFRAVVDTPHPTSFMPDFKRITAAGAPLLRSIHENTNATSDKILRGSIYAPDNRTEEWVNKNAPQVR